MNNQIVNSELLENICNTDGITTMIAAPGITSQSQVYVRNSSYNMNNTNQTNQRRTAVSAVGPATMAATVNSMKDNYSHNSNNNKNNIKHTTTSPIMETLTPPTIASTPAIGIAIMDNQQCQQQHKQSSSYGYNNSQLKFYLQLPHNHQLPLPLHHTQRHLLNQSQSKLKQLQLKQSKTHHHYFQGANYHPYYQASTGKHFAVSAVPLHSTITPQSQGFAAAHALSIYSPNNVAAHSTYIHSVPVHALNQNSNFSAVSSSTGDGTASSHAPTQQSNTTGSSLSPPGSLANARTKIANASVSTTAPNTGILSDKLVNSCKKIRIEPTLTDMYRSERLIFANTHFNWTENNWKRVIFQDERKFNLDGPDGFSCYFHDMRNNERWLSQRPRGNSVFIYLIVMATGPLHLEVSMNKMKIQSCIEIILRERPNIVAKLGGITDFILQDYNWSIHAPQDVREWLNSEDIKTQKWPFIAHDLNIMENVWGWLIREVFEGGRKFSRKDDLVFRIRDAWSRLPLELLSNLYSTLPERIVQLSYTNGGLTNC